MEATGIYSLDLALALDAQTSIELAVLNPKLANRFQQTLSRSKTDAADAVVLAHYSQRMPFTRWQRPGLKGLQLRALARHIGALVSQQSREKNRQHALKNSSTAPRAVIDDLSRSLASVARRIVKMQRALLPADIYTRNRRRQRHPTAGRDRAAGSRSDRAPVGGLERT
jgi:transposase